MHRKAFTQQTFFHRQVFTPCSLYTQELLHAGALTQTPLHKEAFTHRNFHMQKPLDRAAFTHRSFYTQKPLRTEACTPSGFYTPKLLQREAFTQRTFQQSSSYTLQIPTGLFSRPISVHSLASTLGPSPWHPFPSVPLPPQRPCTSAHPPSLMPTATWPFSPPISIRILAPFSPRISTLSLAPAPSPHPCIHARSSPPCAQAVRTRPPFQSFPSLPWHAPTPSAHGRATELAPRAVSTLNENPSIEDASGEKPPACRRVLWMFW